MKSEVVKTDSALFAMFYHGMLDHGMYFAPALYEAGLMSSAHTPADLDETFAAAKEVFSSLI